MFDELYRTALRGVIATGEVAQFLEELLNEADYTSLVEAKRVVEKSLKTYRARRIQRAKELPQAVIQTFRAEVGEQPYNVIQSAIRNDHLLLHLEMGALLEGLMLTTPFRITVWDDEGFCFGTRNQLAIDENNLVYLVEEGM